jgi:LacI family transcriptional regulator
MLATTLELPYPSVEVDYYFAGQLGARHLLELGHKEFGFYWMTEVPDALDVRRGFASEMAAARQSILIGSPCRLRLKGRDVFSVPRDERLAWVDEQLIRLPKPIAIMCDDDRRALELVRAAARVGLKVPDDIAIVGCDNHAVELGMSQVPISSVKIDFRGLGYRAAGLLHEIICGKRLQLIRSRYLLGELSRGDRRQPSSRTNQASPQPSLHLREHFHTPLRIEQLARIAGVSTRLFEIQFRRYVGCSAREEIHRARLACAAKLLRDTDLKLDAIAVESGFGSGKYLSAAFTKVYGSGRPSGANR